MVGDAGAARHGGGTAARAATGLPGATEGAQGRILDSGLVVVRQGELDEAVEVLENLGVPLHGCLPVLVDAALQLCLRGGDFIGVRWCVIVVVGMGGDAV